ncbi:glutamate decarboxylase-like protein 1 [Massariosphaeria phaeospora]|uniref:Glutamate decarboxylase-like protein 1 n=1 Tax=Massariosphaeria phaeospora TaxID=100035 RepID=A0A7C8M559_9PLEO|nr:glutamate decarboxylase-like protein 1 [Massariosphaeria phaeospora]
MAGNSTVDANSARAPLNRSDEVKELLDAIQDLINPFIRSADEDAQTKHTGHGLAVPGGGPRTTLVEHHPPQKLEQLLRLEVPQTRGGKEGLLEIVERVLKYSVNTWDLGFMDKLYGATNAVGVASELLLAVLNTNAHVYQVSPALTLIEKHTTTYLAHLFGFTPATHPHAGGISQPGGSAANSSAFVIARNTLFPSTKTDGNGAHVFTIFTSAHGHYSLEKAAQMFGIGSKHVVSVPVDAAGQMLPAELERLVVESKNKGGTPFFVNATAGTTVLGSFDPFVPLSTICKLHNLWLHIDGSWGGSVVFNSQYRRTRLAGVELADSIAVTPHKMLGVPMTCSFLLGADLRQFHAALTLPAGYLFHNAAAYPADMYDLADLTPQCGRRADSLKMFLALQYYGAQHFSELVGRAYDNAEYLLALVKQHGDFVAVGPEPLPCLQVCFYFARGGRLGDDVEENGQVTAAIAARLISRGFMVDYSPGEKGRFFRVVVNGGTGRSTLEGLVKGIAEVAAQLGY